MRADRPDANAGGKVVFVGQFPPPINGLTFITARLAEALKEAGRDLEIVDVAARNGTRSPSFHAARLAKVLRALGSIASNMRAAHACYFTAEGGLGLIYSVMIAGFARLCRYPLFIHHHSFSYILAWRPLMALLLTVSGPRSTHICLSDGMARDLASRYRREIRAVVISNAAFVPPPSHADRPCRADITIGLLSNLTRDKGLYQFIEIVRLAKERDLPVRGILAGPMGEDDHRFLESLREELVGRLDFRGPIYGEAKERFFGDVDVFVFPTTYRNEAQPTVLFEALAHAIPVIALGRGAIRDQVGAAGFIVEQDAEFIANALDALCIYCNEPALLEAHRRAARSRFEDERRPGQAQIKILFEPELGVAVAA